MNAVKRSFKHLIIYSHTARYYTESTTFPCSLENEGKLLHSQVRPCTRPSLSLISRLTTECIMPSGMKITQSKHHSHSHSLDSLLLQDMQASLITSSRLGKLCHEIFIMKDPVEYQKMPYHNAMDMEPKQTESM